MWKLEAIKRARSGSYTTTAAGISSQLWSSSRKLVIMEFLPTLVVVGILTVILPVITTAYPSSTSPESDCTATIDTATQQEMRGHYDGNGWTVSFTVLLNQETIHSFTTFRNTSDEHSNAIEARLSFPNTPEREIPDMKKHIIGAAIQLTQEMDCNIPAGINVFYQEFADALYKCTMNMGPSQFRFSVMYHETILASANRLCSGAESICTPSPKYELGTGLFICSEDLEELFPNEARQGKEKMLTAKNHAREKRWCLTGLQGSDTCCCGNYEGCCWYSHFGCCIHDIICSCCDQWHCGWACQQEAGCY
jgi:hypothetical protein